MKCPFCEKFCGNSHCSYVQKSDDLEKTVKKLRKKLKKLKKKIK